MKRKPEPLWRRYLRFFGANVEADVDDELRDHIARLESELRERGVPADQIADAVRARFGDAEAIRARLTRADGSRHRRDLRLEAFGNLGQDVGYALRRLRQRPGFTAAVVVVLALGVGATTAMFSAVDAAMLRPLPFAHPDRLLLMHEIQLPFDAGPGNPAPTFHFPDYDDAAGMRNTFASVAGYAAGTLNLGDPTRPMRVKVGVVTPSFFTTLGRVPVRGRPFTGDEGKPRGPAVAILSDGLWRSHFGQRPVLDSVIVLSGKPYRVVGVMPPGFSFPDESDLWIPLTNPTTFDTFAAFRSFLPSYVIGRLAEGVSAPAAEAQLQALWTRDAALASAADSNATPMVRQTIAGLRKDGFAVPFRTALVGDHRTALLILLGATGLLLLIACANVTNLLLSQAAARRQEIALRAVLGATRRRIVRQLLTESVTLALAGTVLGILLAPLGLQLLTTLMPPRLAGIAPPEIDLRVLGFAAALALVTGVGFGLWPAWGASRAQLADAVKAGGRGATAGGAGRGRRMLVAAELALTVLLLVGAGLMLRSFDRMMHEPVGLDAHGVGTLEFTFDAGGNGADRVARIRSMVSRLESSPGISAAGIVNMLPLGGEGGIAISVRAADRPEPPRDSMKYARYLICSAGYFRAMGIPLLEGRTFTVADDSTAPRVAIVSRAMADGLWPNEDPIGRQFPMMANRLITVVGVVGDVRDSGIERKPGYQMYFPVGQQGTGYLALVARGALAPSAMLSRLREAVRAVDPSQAVYRVRMMDDVVSSSVAPQRTNTLLISLFGALALVLTALGVYAVIAYSVAQRRRELGIRAALGASGRNLVGLVSREMVWVTAGGLLVGLAGAWAASRVMASLVYGVTTHDPATFVIAPLALLIPAAIATLLPARRAARTNPVDVIREE